MHRSSKCFVNKFCVSVTWSQQTPTAVQLASLSNACLLHKFNVAAHSPLLHHQGLQRRNHHKWQTDIGEKLQDRKWTTAICRGRCHNQQSLRQRRLNNAILTPRLFLLIKSHFRATVQCLFSQYPGHFLWGPCSVILTCPWAALSTLGCGTCQQIFDECFDCTAQRLAWANKPGCWCARVRIGPWRCCPRWRLRSLRKKKLRIW